MATRKRPEDLQLLRGRKPVAPAAAESPLEERLAPEATVVKSDEPLIVNEYWVRIEEVPQKREGVQYRGSLVAVEYLSPEDLEAASFEDLIPEETPRIDFEFIVRQIQHERVRYLRHLLHREPGTGTIDDRLPHKVYDAQVQDMAVKVSVDGRPAPDFGPVVKPLVVQAYALLKRDKARTGAKSGTYAVYEFT